jgi:hypothetical protein
MDFSLQNKSSIKHSTLKPWKFIHIDTKQVDLFYKKVSANKLNSYRAGPWNVLALYVALLHKLDSSMK